MPVCVHVKHVCVCVCESRHLDLRIYPISGRQMCHKFAHWHIHCATRFRSASFTLIIKYNKYVDFHLSFAQRTQAINAKQHSRCTHIA